MVFDNLKASLTSKRRRRASAALSDLPVMRYEDTPAAATPPTSTPPLMKSRSLRAILIPGIPSFKPLTVSNFLSIGKTPKTMDDFPDEILIPIDYAGEDPEVARAKLSIKRKPVGLNIPLDPRTAAYKPSFDPQAARKDASLHVRARKVLFKRYQSKFSLPADFIPYEGTNILDYAFLWVKPGELEKKVLEDIVWVRERFAYARKSEPTDEDLIHWYEAQVFDEGYEGYWYERRAAMMKDALAALPVDEEVKVAEEVEKGSEKDSEESDIRDTRSIEVNIGEDEEGTESED